MKRSELQQAVADYKNVTHDALQLIWDNTNKGQRNKLLKKPDILALLERYNITKED